MISAMKVKQFMNEDPGITEAFLLERYNQLSLKKISDLAINGNDLQQIFNRPPGPWIADLVEEIEQSVVLGEVNNSLPDIKEWIKECNQPREND
jgi:tRNA nucleotidyltransferase (CCA-adding enzyme)